MRMKPLIPISAAVLSTFLIVDVVAADEQPPVAVADETASEDPFFGLNVGAKGTAGGNVWTAPSNSPFWALLFDETTGGWGAGGGLYAEFRVLWGHLGLEIDLLFESNRIWHQITWNQVLETEWILNWTSLRLPILLEGNLEGDLVRAGLGVGPEIVVGLAAETELKVTDGEQFISQAELDRLRSGFSTTKQTDTYMVVALGLAFKVWKLAITFDLRAGFNLTQPEDHDDRLTYELGQNNQVDGFEAIASSSMDFRMLLGLAWEHGFDL